MRWAMTGLAWLRLRWQTPRSFAALTTLSAMSGKANFKASLTFLSGVKICSFASLCFFKFARNVSDLSCICFFTTAVPDSALVVKLWFGCFLSFKTD